MTEYTAIIEKDIVLKADIEMSTVDGVKRIFPAGTVVRYERLEFNGEDLANDWDEVTEIHHCAIVYHEDERYSVCKIFVPSK